MNEMPPGVWPELLKLEPPVPAPKKSGLTIAPAVFLSLIIAAAFILSFVALKPGNAANEAVDHVHMDMGAWVQTYTNAGEHLDRSEIVSINSAETQVTTDFTSIDAYQQQGKYSDEAAYSAAQSSAITDMEYAAVSIRTDITGLRDDATVLDDWNSFEVDYQKFLAAS